MVSLRTALAHCVIFFLLFVGRVELSLCFPCCSGSLQNHRFRIGLNFFTGKLVVVVIVKLEDIFLFFFLLDFFTFIVLFLRIGRVGPPVLAFLAALFAVAMLLLISLAFAFAVAILVVILIFLLAALWKVRFALKTWKYKLISSLFWLLFKSFVYRKRCLQRCRDIPSDKLASRRESVKNRQLEKVQESSISQWVSCIPYNSCSSSTR